MTRTLRTLTAPSAHLRGARGAPFGSPYGGEPRGCATHRAPMQGSGFARSEWQPISHNPRTIIVTCSECQVGTVNETNAMHRAGWQESSVGRHRRYLCADCAEVTA
jgi:hypothetical protein